MKINVWGARGSIPVSGRDYVDFGGDTTCLQLDAESGETIVLDAGTGIRRLGAEIASDPARFGPLHLLLTHAHWDHIMGFPFFRPVYRKNVTIRVHGCTNAQESIRLFLEEAMHPPFFPVPLDRVAANLFFAGRCDMVFDIGSVRVGTFPLNHPNGGFGFRFTEGERSFAFFPDYELMLDHPGGRPYGDLVEFIKDVDLLIFDAEYLREEYEKTRGFGHSVYEDTVRLAKDAGADRLMLWHLNQDRTDGGVRAMVENARELASEGGGGPEVEAASTGLSASL